MNRVFLCLATLLWLSTSAYGQAAYNPYAPQEVDPSPIAVDGTPNWPAFFKSAAMHDRFQSYFKAGSCVGTRKSINAKLNDNQVDVNKLPSSEVSGKACDIAAAGVRLHDNQGGSIVVVVHPAGVSRVSITGELPLTQLRPGMPVLFVGSVDSKGRSTEAIHTLEVVDGSPRWEKCEVVPGKLQTIAGSIAKLHGDQLQLRVAGGKLHTLTFLLAPDIKVSVAASDLSLISPGDEVKASGHVYVGPGIAASKLLFASEVTVQKADITSGQIARGSTDALRGH